MSFKKKMLALFAVTVIWSTSLIAQASCSLNWSIAYHGFRVSNWSCSDGNWETGSYYSDGSWHVQWNRQL